MGGLRGTTPNILRNISVALTAAQHCSSLCLQSEGDEDWGEPIADLSILATYPWPSLCEQSELQCCRPSHAPKEIRLIRYLSAPHNRRAALLPDSIRQRDYHARHPGVDGLQAVFEFRDHAARHRAIGFQRLESRAVDFGDDVA